MSAAQSLQASAVLGLHHVQLSFAPQLQAQMEHFYGHLLGLRPMPHSAVAYVLSYAAGGQRIDLMPRRIAAGTVQLGGHGHLALQVADASSLQQHLLRHGAMVLAVVQVQEGLRFYAKDPAGNTLEFLQPQTVAMPVVSKPAQLQHAAYA